MSKSVYSVVLVDRLVEMLDERARRQGVNRSAMLNRIMAEAFGVATEDDQIDSFLSAVGKVAQSGKMLVLESQAKNAILLQTCLNAKYSPKVKFLVNISSLERGVGVIRIGIRSTSDYLLQAVNSFFSLYSRLEEIYLGKSSCVVENGKMMRLFNFNNWQKSTCNLPLAITKFISNFNGLLDLYLSNLQYNDVIKKVQLAYKLQLDDIEI